MTCLLMAAVKQAQRFAHAPAQMPVWRVSVEAVSDRRQTTIDLCDRCLTSEDRAWRLRWRPVPFAR